MNNEKVIEYLRDYLSYKYAVMNTGQADYDVLSLVYSERMKTRNPNTWDAARYTRIVNMIEGAVNSVLSDDQRTVIMRKYMDRNKLNINEIADVIKRDRSTVSRWHTEAIRQLAKALMPLTEEDREITNLDHMFDKEWVFKEPA